MTVASSKESPRREVKTRLSQHRQCSFAQFHRAVEPAAMNEKVGSAWPYAGGEGCVVPGVEGVSFGEAEVVACSPRKSGSLA